MMNKTANWISKRMRPQDQETISQWIDADMPESTPEIEWQNAGTRSLLGLPPATKDEIQYQDDMLMQAGMAGIGSIKDVGKGLISMMTPEAQALRGRIAKTNALEKVNEPQGKIIQVEGGGLDDIKAAQEDWKDLALGKLEKEWKEIDRSERYGFTMNPDEKISLLKKRMEKAQEIADNFPDQGWYKNESWRVPNKINEVEAGGLFKQIRGELQDLEKSDSSLTKEMAQDYNRRIEEYFNHPGSDKDVYARILLKSLLDENIRRIGINADVVPLETGLKEPIGKQKEIKYSGKKIKKISDPTF